MKYFYSHFHILTSDGDKNGLNACSPFYWKCEPGLYTVLPQVLHRGIIRVLQAQFSSLNFLIVEIMM